MALSANSSVEPPLFLKLSADQTLVKNKINCFACQEVHNAASRKKQQQQQQNFDILK